MNAEPERNDDNEIIEVDTVPMLPNYVGALDKAQIDVQITTAKQYPRSIDKALKEAMTLATMDEDTAGSMFYVLPRSGKKIEGPSARLAEVMAYSWQNLRAESDVIDADDKYVTAMGTCFDLERNVAVRVRVKRRITDKNGVRYNDDMIGVTSNAATSIALRNAVFKVIPQALTKRIYEAARKASIGKAGTITQKRQNALTWFNKAGLNDKQVFELVGVRGVDDLDEEKLIELRGIKTALSDGDTTIEQLLSRSRVESDGTAELNAAVKAGNTESKKAEPEKYSEQYRKIMNALADVPGKELTLWAKKMSTAIERLPAAEQTLVQSEISRMSDLPF